MSKILVFKPIQWAAALALVWCHMSAAASAPPLDCGIYVRLEGDPSSIVGAAPREYCKNGADQNGPWFSYFGSDKYTVEYYGSGRMLSIKLVPPAGETLQFGRTYAIATRYPFNSSVSPGMDFATDSQGCNFVNGWFVIRENWSADFVVYCDEFLWGDAIRGSVRYGASQLAVPAPGPIAVLKRDRFFEAEGTTVALDSSLSMGMASTIVSRHWEQVSGPAASIDNPNAARIGVTLPSGLRIGGADLVFRVTVVDDGGLTASADAKVHVASRSDPRTYFEFTSDPADFIGGGRPALFDEANSILSPWTSTGPGGPNDPTFGFDVTGVSDRMASDVFRESDWSLAFDPAGLALLQLGTQTNAVRWPFNAFGQAGLDVSGEHRGCNFGGGWFEVQRIGRDRDDKPYLEIRFEQDCDPVGSDSLRGHLVLNLRDPGVPRADAGANKVVVPGEVVMLDGRNSTDPQGDALGFEWSSAQPGLTLVGASTQSVMFTAPVLAPGVTSKPYDLSLLVSDPGGLQDLDKVTVTVMPNADLSVSLSPVVTKKKPIKGSKVQFNFSVSNLSPLVAATNVQVRINFGLQSVAKYLSTTFVGASCSTVGTESICTIPSLAPGRRLTGIASLKATKKGNLLLRATATSTTPDLVSSNNSSSSTVTIR